MKINEFTYETYESLLRALLKSRDSLCFRDFRDGESNGPFVLLRHDVDYSLEAALRMAEFEARLGVSATYFLLFSSPFYCLLSDNSADFPRRLMAMGHEVGLHYDVRAFKSATEPTLFPQLLSAQVELLSVLTGDEVVSIAMHNPSLGGEDPFVNGSYVSAYEDRFTKDIAYYSDSCGAWRDEFVRLVKGDDLPPKLQLLTHPMYWCRTPETRWDVIDELVEHRMGFLETQRKLIKRLCANHSGVREHDQRVSMPLKEGGV